MPEFYILRVFIIDMNIGEQLKTYDNKIITRKSS